MSDTNEYNWVSIGSHYNYPEAWECPRCHVINAPHANYCENCKPARATIVSNAAEGFTYRNIYITP